MSAYNAGKEARLIERVHGQVDNLRPQQLRLLRNLYRRRVPQDAVINTETARATALISLEINRPISLLLDRRGRVITVAVGDADTVLIPEWHGEQESRLYGLRLVHTHLTEAKLSPNDLTTLFINRLDAIAAVHVTDEVPGYLGAAQLATIASQEAEEENWIIEDFPQFIQLERDNFQDRIFALEEELSRTIASREVHRRSEERAILVGVQHRESQEEAGERLDELAELVTSAGVEVAATEMQSRRSLDPRSVVGSGKLEELVSLAFHADADVLVFDRELAPAQAREIERKTHLKVVDRTQVILDIFAQNASGREAQVQVELAQLHYQLPRLVGRGTELSRLAGGIGTRGPGETKLEVDRRRIRDRISALEKTVDTISRRRAETRKGRTHGATPVVGLVGYTNAGKSTLFNALTKADVLSENRLFATLRPTSREGWLPGLGSWGATVVFTDTVGFIRDLPEELVNAFRATLEELHDADMLLHIVDASSPTALEKVEAVERILGELEIDRPGFTVLNKADLIDKELAEELALRFDATLVSAVTGEGLDELRDRITRELTARYTVLSPGEKPTYKNPDHP